MSPGEGEHPVHRADWSLGSCEPWNNKTIVMKVPTTIHRTYCFVVTYEVLSDSHKICE